MGTRGGRCAASFEEPARNCRQIPPMRILATLETAHKALVYWRFDYHPDISWGVLLNDEGYAVPDYGDPKHQFSQEEMGEGPRDLRSRIDARRSDSLRAVPGHRQQDY